MREQTTNRQSQNFYVKFLELLRRKYLKFRKETILRKNRIHKKLKTSDE